MIISEKQARKQAASYFSECCQVRASKAGTEKMRSAGIKTLKKIREHVQIKCTYAGTSDFLIHNNILTIENTNLKCNVLEKFDRSNICKVYLYIVTSGVYKTDSEQLSEVFYTDSWGSAYVQAAKDIIRDEIQEQNSDLYVMESFGPGYFGMRLQEISKFFQLLNSKPIGVIYNEGGLMVPIKSLAGINIVLKEPINIDFDDCRSCIGDKSGCEFCSTKVKMRER